MPYHKFLLSIKVFTIAFLKILLTLIILILVYMGSILITNGYGQGKAAACIEVILTLIVLFVFWKRTWLKSKCSLGFLTFFVLLLCALTIYTVVPVASTVARVTNTPFPGVPTNYWYLKTGSIIAYYKLPASRKVVKKKFPIIFLHGGPGAYIRKLDINFFLKFTDEGYDVFLYDQAGSGRSALLPKLEYSHERNIMDFENIIDKIGAAQYIVIGQSYGGSLLASLTARNNTSRRIYKAIFAEPGVTVLSGEQIVFSRFPNAGKDDAGIPLRLFIGILLNPRGDFTSQNEVINYFFEHKSLIPKLFKSAFPLRDSSRIPAVELNALNFAMNGIVAPQVNDYNKNLAREYLKDKIPSMLLIGESSYIARNAPMDLLKINPNIIRVQYFKNTGHLLWNGLDNNNNVVKKAIDEFLNGQYSTLPNYPTRNDIVQFFKSKM